jgi:hypothetical protein
MLKVSPAGVGLTENQMLRPLFPAAENQSALILPDNCSAKRSIEEKSAGV